MNRITNLRARDVMRKDVATLAVDDTIDTALALFEDAHIGGAPVLATDGRLTGVLTLSDLARSERRGEARLERRRRYDLSEPTGEERLDELDPSAVFFLKEDYSAEVLGRELVGEWMTRSVIHVGPEEPLTAVCRRMLEANVHRIFVCEGEHLVGVVSSFDVVRAVAG